MTGTSVSAEFLARLRAFIRSRVRTEADAEDLVQDVLYKLFRQGEHAIKGSIHAWLFTVARHAIIDSHRARRSTAPIDSVPEPSVALEARSAGSELARCLAPMLLSMAKEDRSLLIRVDGNGEAQADVARELGLPLSTVKSRVQRARARLRRRLEGCCSIELDSRGHPHDYKRRRGRSCPCDPS
jgi:RNA polymerase sigma-70 factor, ECF subfamily